MLNLVLPLTCCYQIDATQDKELASEYGVKGYPSIKWFLNGELIGDYNGVRVA